MNGENDKKKKRWLLLIMYLVLAVAITSSILGYLMSQKSENNNSNLIDTIELSPEKTGEVPLSICGIVNDSNGRPYANGKVELHSTPRDTTTDANGKFFFYDVNAGEHHIYIVNSTGKRLAEVSFEILRSDEYIDTEIVSNLNKEYSIQIPQNALMIEIDVEFDEENKKAIVDKKNITTVFNNGIVSQGGVAINVDDVGVCLTSQGAAVLNTHDINVAGEGVILSNGIFIPNGTKDISELDINLSNGETLEDGILGLTDGTKIDLIKDQVLLTDSSIIKENCIYFKEGIIINNKDNTITTADGIVYRNGEDVENDLGYTVKAPANGAYIIGKDTSYPINALPKKDVEEVAKEIISKEITSDKISTNDRDTEDTKGSIVENEKKPSEDDKSAEGADNKNDDASSVKTDIAGKKSGNGGGSTQANEREDNGSFAIKHENGEAWTQLSKADLFKDIEKLCPGMKGEYSFRLANTRKTPLNFTISAMEQIEDLSIPLKYRLKVKGSDEYVICGGNNSYVSANDIKTKIAKLSAKSEIIYTLEWIWEYDGGTDKLDTKLGTDENREHIIIFTINVEEEV